MTTVHVGAERIAYAKGAAEVVLPRTTLDDGERARAVAAAGAMEADALRVLAVARRVLPPDCGDEPDAIERELEFLGLVGMSDPPRPEVADAVQRCRQAGVRIIMVTGDSGATAEAIARRIGLVDGEVHVITGGDLAHLDDDELRRRLTERDVVFARIDPEQKLRLAELLRADGEVLAMTGDGVNDAPALKHADIGIAMGRGGTEVAKEASDLILIDTDLIPAIALGTERAEPGTMTRPPRRRSERLLDRAVLGRVFGWIGPLEGLAALSSFLFAYGLTGWRPWGALADTGTLYLEATTMTMAGIVMAQIGAGLGWRTNRESVASIGPLSNRLLLVGIAAEIAMIALLAYTPGLTSPFDASALGPWHWLFLLVWPPLVMGAEEARKAVVRSRTSRATAT